MKTVWGLVPILAALVALAGSSDVTPPGKAFYLGLPDDEKHDFLIFSLGHGYTKKTTKLQRTSAPDFRFPDSLGISEEHIEKFQQLIYPDDFTSNLYVWIRARYNLNEVKMRTLILQRMVCLENGNCIDIDDVGGLCCPF
ncbi:uncharacterized protein [Venturia canescens]|uniref:uncharacterized protein n=1 Tax=Venturia canescens TaxID=32260 RepID=UPI001C9D1507|nr:uncharacterized protein LOC122418055 [Venturia canescens]